MWQEVTLDPYMRLAILSRPNKLSEDEARFCKAAQVITEHIDRKNEKGVMSVFVLKNKS